MSAPLKHARLIDRLERLFIFTLMFIIIGCGVVAVEKAMRLPVEPRLVGHGCVGTHGDIYADEEDDFPRCAVIEAR